MSNTSKMNVLKDIPQLLDCMFEHEVTKTTVKYDIKCPRISREVWNEVLAFFRWTFKEHASESQVRLYVHPVQGWRAWAYPQRARTGMAAHELGESDLGYERSKEQRAQFNPDEGWLYWGTAHHHCSASAFQSGTDANNESSQDGLHITVGGMGSDQFSIDVRFYHCGYKLGSFDLSKMWDIGNALEVVPKELRSLLPDNVNHMIALRQMGVPPPEDCPFNQVWRENVIEPPKPLTQVGRITSHGQWNPNLGNGSAAKHNLTGEFNLLGQYRHGWKSEELYVARCFPALSSDINNAILEIKEWFKLNPNNDFESKMDQLCMEFEELDRSCGNDMIELLELVLRNDVNLPAFSAALAAHVAEEEAKEEAEEARQLMMEQEGAPPAEDKSSLEDHNPGYGYLGMMGMD